MAGKEKQSMPEAVPVGWEKPKPVKRPATARETPRSVQRQRVADLTRRVRKARTGAS